MDAVGGSNNAMTYYDFTAYVDDVPPGELGVAIALEADRMVNLDLRKKQVETERDVVAEERLSSVEDDVDGILDELMYKQAFKTHPYRWPVIGSMKDIKAITQEKAVAFYKKYYAPNNAVLVVAGKIEEAPTLAAIAAAYGEHPAVEEAARGHRQAGARARRRGAHRRRAPGPRRSARRSGSRRPALGAPDRAAYEVLNELLAAGRRRASTARWSSIGSGPRRSTATSRRRAIRACTRSGSR